MKNYLNLKKEAQQQHYKNKKAYNKQHKNKKLFQGTLKIIQIKNLIIWKIN